MKKRTKIKPSPFLVITIGVTLFFLLIIIYCLLQIKGEKLYRDDLPSVDEIFSRFDTKSIAQMEEVARNQEKEYEKTILKNGDLKVIQLSEQEGGDTLTGGGCILNSSQYLFVYSDSTYYDITLDNIILLLNPHDREDYLSIVKFYQRFHPSFCGITEYYALNDYTYKLNTEFTDSCSLDKKYSLESKLENKDGVVELTFFEENIQSPLQLSKYIFTVKDGKGKIQHTETVYECDTGIMY